MFATDEANRHPTAIWKQHSFSEIDPQWPRMLNPLLQMQQDRLIDELVNFSPEFEIGVSSYSLSELGSERGRSVELWHDNGLQIYLYLDSVSIDIPYWYRSKYEVDIIFKQISGCAMIIQNVAGYTNIEDRQVDEMIKLPDGIADMKHAYLHTMGLIEKHIG